MTDAEFWEKAYTKAVEHTNTLLPSCSQVDRDDLSLEWASKTFRDRKAVLSANIPYKMHYEIIWNEDRQEMTLDIYRKTGHEVIL